MSERIYVVIIPSRDRDPYFFALSRSTMASSFWQLPENLPQIFKGTTQAEWQTLCSLHNSVNRTCLPVHISTSVVVFRCCVASPDLMPNNSLNTMTQSKKQLPLHMWETLLLWHSKANEWVYPGGHADGDWNFLRSALRELKEETGLSPLNLWSPPHVDPAVPVLVQKIAISQFQSTASHFHMDVVYFVECLNWAKVSIAEAESKKYIWWKLDRQLSELPVVTANAIEVLKNSIAKH